MHICLGCISLFGVYLPTRIPSSESPNVAEETDINLPIAIASSTVAHCPPARPQRCFTFVYPIVQW